MGEIEPGERRVAREALNPRRASEDALFWSVALGDSALTRPSPAARPDWGRPVGFPALTVGLHPSSQSGPARHGNPPMHLSDVAASGIAL